MQTKLYIGGEWRDGSNGVTKPVTNPSTGEHITDVAAASTDDATAACQAAHEAQVLWAGVAPREKAEILRRCWELMMQHQDELAELIVTEHGKPVADARGEVAYAAEFFRWNSEEATRIHGSIGMAPSGANRIIVHHPPVGVVVIVTPWNFPAAMITRKLAPALAAGNGVVIKPPTETPLTALRIAELLTEAGVPGGLVNVTVAESPGDWFDAAVDHPATRMVSFTGSTRTGQRLLKRAADRVLKTVMELGGNAPFIVFDDADVDAAVEGAMVAKMRHSAETCTAANRFFVHADVAEEFTTKFTAAMAGHHRGWRLRGRRRVWSAHPRSGGRQGGRTRRRRRRGRRPGRRSAARGSTGRAVSTPRPCSPTSRPAPRSPGKRSSALSHRSSRSPTPTR